ncbi:GNAT family N-acetyltransferase [Lapidilactobacillus luobeiensis]|uniref:GNAT family N-acetyltransferase n=1 Tax=Lapidilactobacillus luobeiensis TaxID=2950371 RepID=UPI0021C428E0|nr:GNAT family N-acetyltransferase [Lapidilactobacillus luobeiensis]
MSDALEVTLRPALPTDEGPLREFWQQEVSPCDLLLSDDSVLRLSASALADQLGALYESPNNLLLLALAGPTEVIGYLRIAAGSEPAIRHVGELGLVVATAYRRQGLGRALMATALDWAQETGLLSRLQLEVQQRNQAAQQLYREFGFQLEGHLRASYRSTSGKLIDTLLMAKLL